MTTALHKPGGNKVETDPEMLYHRWLAYNQRAHELWWQSDGEIGWPPREYHDLPVRTDHRKATG